MTIPHEKQVKGLQIKTKEGQWIEVDPSPSSFIVMAGDVCMAWTNGRIEAPYHMVMMQGKEERYSLGIFTFIRGLNIQILQKLIDEDHPPRFKEFDHYKYIHYHRYTNVGKKSECPIIIEAVIVQNKDATTCLLDHMHVSFKFFLYSNSIYRINTYKLCKHLQNKGVTTTT
ncbi:unnamed protein product [Lactuca virosa]|nr:unnamed protein product [Lactuca virosa]